MTEEEQKSFIKAYLNHIHPVDGDILEEYLAEWKSYTLPKRYVMTVPGDTERYMYFVLDGIQKSYYLNDGKQHIIAFTYAPSFTGIPESFLNQTPSNYYLETITDSAFVRLPYGTHQRCMRDHRSLETLFRRAAEKFLTGMLERHHELMAYDIEQRFKSFTRRSPHLLNMVAQKDIASYLRIDASNFSRLLGKHRI